AELVATYDYDGIGRLARVGQRLPGAGDQFRYKSFRLDGVGNTWRESDWAASGDAAATVIITIDPFGRAEKSVVSDGAGTESVYTATRRSDVRVFSSGGTNPVVRSVTDRDARGNVIRVLEDKKPTTLAEDLENPSTGDFVISDHDFDLMGRMTDVWVSGTGGVQHRLFTYDSRGLLTSETHPERGVVSYCNHSAAGAPGRVAYGVNADQCATTNVSTGLVDTVLDAAARPLESWVKQGGQWYLATQTVYGNDPVANSVGRPTHVDQFNMVTASPAAPVGGIDPDSIRVRQSYFYTGPQGSLNKRTTEVAFGGDGSDGVKTFEIGYEYDLWGNVELVAYPRLDPSNSCEPAHDLRYTYDVSGLLAIDEEFESTFTASLLSGAVYDSDTAMMQQWYTAAGPGGGSYVFHEVTPDGTRARPLRIVARMNGTGGATVFDTGDYAYDGAGNVKSMAGSSGVTAGWTYTYDALSRLGAATQGTSNTRAYTYDDFGNITSIGGQSIGVSPTTNRLSAAGIAYDTRGNLVAEPVATNWTRNARYDLFNRLVAAWSTGTNAPADTYSFAYDQAGERVLRYRLEGGAVQEARFFIRDEGGNVLSEFQWAPQVAGDRTGLWTRMADTAYLGREPLVLMVDTSGSQREYTTMITDHLGSVRAEVTTTGTVPQGIDYWPFGEIVNRPAILKSKHLFTGHEREYTGSVSGFSSLEGLDYMHARYYNL
ncbi:MAG: hypothetical protein ACC742_16880, partial [Thermoanaerobaculales bacterium]